MDNVGVHVFEQKFHPIHTFIVGSNAFTQLWK